MPEISPGLSPDEHAALTRWVSAAAVAAGIPGLDVSQAVHAMITATVTGTAAADVVLDLLRRGARHPAGDDHLAQVPLVVQRVLDRQQPGPMSPAWLTILASRWPRYAGLRVPGFREAVSHADDGPASTESGAVAGDAR